MGKKPVKIGAFLKRFVKNAKKAFDIDQIILFGSRVRGDALKHSDYDLLVVSGDFAGKPFAQRNSELVMKTNPEFNFEFLCYTPEEFEKKKGQAGIVRNAVKEGISIA